MTEMTTITVSDATAGQIHESLEATVRNLVDVLRFSSEYPASTVKLLRESLDDVQTAFDEFETAWFDAEEKKDERRKVTMP